MKRIFYITTMLVALLINEACGQVYEPIRGIAEDTLLIGKTIRWFEFFKDQDSAWVKVKMFSKGKDSIFVLADTNWVKRHSIDTAKKYIWMAEHEYKKGIKNDSLLYHDSLGRMTLPINAIGKREIKIENGFVKYIDENDTIRTIPTIDYLEDSLKTWIDSVLVMNGQFVNVKPSKFIKFGNNSGMYLPTFMNDEGMFKLSNRKILYQTDVGIDTVATEKFIKEILDSIYSRLSSLENDSLHYATPLWKIGNEIKLEIEDPLVIIDSDRLGVRYADSTHAGIISSSDYLLFKLNLNPTSYWYIDEPDIKTNKVVNLSNTSLVLPITADDPGKIMFGSNKLKYFDNSSLKNVASEEYVLGLIDSLTLTYNYWESNSFYLKPNSNYKLDLRDRGAFLPTYSNDIGMFFLASDDKIKYDVSSGRLTIATESYADNLFSGLENAISDSNYWALNNWFILPKPGKVLDLTNSGLYLPHYANDDRMIYLDNADNKIKYVRDILKVVANEDFVIEKINYLKSTTIDSIKSDIGTLFVDAYELYDMIDKVYSDFSVNTSGVAVHWDNLTNLPTTFNPSPHTHLASEINYNSITLDNELLSIINDIASHEDAIIELDANKQSTLISGSNIKTINSFSLLGSGDISVLTSEVDGSTTNELQTLGTYGDYITLSNGGGSITAPYATNANYANNAGNASTVTNGVYTSGSYSNPSWISDLAWSKISSKPSFATVATSGSYTDLINKPTVSWNATTVNTVGYGLEVVDGGLQIDFTPFSGSYTDLTNKPTIPTISVGALNEQYFGDLDIYVYTRDLIVNGTVLTPIVTSIER